MRSTVFSPTTSKTRNNIIPYPYEVHYTIVDDKIRIAYIDEGPADATVLFFIHGLGSGIPEWRKNIDVLKNNFRCIAIDLPGHGLSERDSFSYTMDFYAGIVLQFLNKVEIKSVIIVGHSMGAQMAVFASLKNKELFRKIILVGPAGLESYSIFEQEAMIGKANTVALTGGAFVSNDLNFFIGFNNDKDSAQDLLSELIFHSEDYDEFAEVFRKSIAAMLKAPLTGLIKNLSTECLVIVGEKDFASPYNYLRLESYASMVRRVARNMPDVQIEVVPEGCHFLPYHMPELFNSLVQEFATYKFF